MRTTKLTGTTRLIALASALVATTALASAAEAGGGIRLGFGVPLGSFVATPAHGGGAYRTPKAGTRPAMHAARKQKRPPQRVAKAEPRRDVTKDEAADKTGVTATAAPLTGSSALIQGSVPVAEPAPETAAPTVEAKAPARTTAATRTGDGAPDEKKSCKKFIPAVGMTVSVSCE
jgi:hypothetical protein